MKRFLTKRNSLLVLTFLFLLIAWNRDINLLYGMFSLLAGTLSVSLLLPRYSVKNVRGSRAFPRSALEGDEIRIDVEIENRRWKNAYMLEVVDSFPAAEVGFRNPMTFIGKLRGREKKRYSYFASCYKRGEYAIGPMKVLSSYPLGVASVEKELQKEPLSLIVYPSVFEIARLAFLSGNSALAAISDAAVKAGGGEDFYGTREYRRGDSLRYIHWPSSARQGEFIVKEFERRASEEVTIILDLEKGSDTGSGRESTLEYSVRIAASFARYILERGHGLQLICYGKKEYLIPYGRGLNQLGKVMEALARVQADGNLSYSSAVQQASEFLRDGDSAVLFFCRGNENMDNFSYSLGLLRAKRVRPVGIMINRASFHTNEPKKSVKEKRFAEELLAIGAAVFHVSKGDDLSGVFG